MKTLLLTLILVAFAAISSAETFKWEDKNGVHFTDNPFSIPKKYRQKAIDEARGDITTANPDIAASVAVGNRQQAVRDAEDRARNDALERRNAAIAAEAERGKLEKKDRKKFAREVAREVDRKAQQREALKELSKPLPPFKDYGADMRRRDMEDKVDRIDRKLRGW